MNIPVYRHLAVAISRKHLKYGGFKRDYGIEESVVDRQGSHTLWTAGTTYARGLEEAAGHVEARKLEYRKVSQEWQLSMRQNEVSSSLVELRSHSQ
jgi:hypothetical protein